MSSRDVESNGPSGGLPSYSTLSIGSGWYTHWRCTAVLCCGSGSCLNTSPITPLVAIPRHAWDSAEALALVDAGEPVVLLASGFLQPAVDRWTLDYLVEHAGEDNAFAVFRSAGDFLNDVHEREEIRCRVHEVIRHTNDSFEVATTLLAPFVQHKHLWTADIQAELANFLTDNPAFTCKPGETIAAKKKVTIDVAYKPVPPEDGDTLEPVTHASLYVQIVDKKLSAWRYYLEGHNEEE